MWSYYFDRNRVHEIDARAQKRLRSLQEKETRLKVGISAVDVTSSVIATQDKHKKRALLEMQLNLQTAARIQKRWRNLLADVCQPNAVWDTGQPNSAWVLDQSEGPLRMRKRLVLTPMDCDMSNVSRSPMKAVVKPTTPPPPPPAQAGEQADFLSDEGAAVGLGADGSAGTTTAGTARSLAESLSSSSTVRDDGAASPPDAVSLDTSRDSDGVLLSTTTQEDEQAREENDRARFEAWCVCPSISSSFFFFFDCWSCFSLLFRGS